MRLWLVWWSVIEPLREVCARQASFLWLAVTTAGICARGDLLGVSSIVRTLGLAGRCYDRLLDFFHSPAVDPRPPQPPMDPTGDGIISGVSLRRPTGAAR